MSISNAPSGEIRIGRLGVGSFEAKSTGYWGMVMLVVTEACLFAYLLFSYYYFFIQGGRSFQPAELPGFTLSGPNTAILLASSGTVWFGEHLLRTRGSRAALLAGYGIAIVLGVVFISIQLLEWSDKPFTLWSTPYASLFFTVTGFHMLHVAAGVLVLAALFVWGALGYFDRTRTLAVSAGALYWHFVDAVWLTVWFSFYILPHMTVT